MSQTGAGPECRRASLLRSLRPNPSREDKGRPTVTDYSTLSGTTLGLSSPWHPYVHGDGRSKAAGSDGTTIHSVRVGSQALCSRVYLERVRSSRQVCQQHGKHPRPPPSPGNRKGI